MRQSSFGADVNFDDVVEAAGVEMSPKGLYFAKPFRNCESLAAFNGAVRMALAAKDREIQRLHKQNAEIADRSSKEASKRASLAEEIKEVTKVAIARGLESTDLAPSTRERLLAVNTKA